MSLPGGLGQAIAWCQVHEARVTFGHLADGTPEVVVRAHVRGTMRQVARPVFTEAVELIKGELEKVCSIPGCGCTGLEHP